MKQVRTIDGRLEMWLQFPLPGGWVCAEPDDATQGGMCGVPVGSQPCSTHHPDAAADPDRAATLAALLAERFGPGGVR